MMQYGLVLMLAAVALAQNNAPQYKAIAKLASPGSFDVQGNITFTQLPGGNVHVEGIILGQSHGKYGFHVHEKGDLTGGCLSAGGHFNPEHKNHGHPNDSDRHVGDLGNIEFDENRIARVDITDKKISLFGPNSILGRAIVLHEREDDFGKSTHPDSKKTGNAGGRVACGVIGILDPIYNWKTNEAYRPSITAAVFLPMLTVLAIVY